MAGPVNFTINYTCSPNAVNGRLEYRSLQPDGTYSAWHQNATLGVFNINTQGGTVLNQTLTNIPGDGLDFKYNTTYEFRIEQFCSTGLIEYSDISDPIYEENCMRVDFLVNNDYVDSSYSFTVNIYDTAGSGNPMNPLGYSITNYHLELFLVVGAVRTSVGIFDIPYTDIVPGDPFYSLLITKDDLVQPIIESGQLYELEVSFTVNTGTGTQTVLCATESVTTYACATYKIYTGEFWGLEWTDCNGVKRSCFSDTPAPRSDNSGNNILNSFYVCSRTVPFGYACVQSTPGVFVKSSPYYISPTTGNPTYITNPIQPGQLPAYPINRGAVVENYDPTGCDSINNGDLPTIIFDTTGITFTCDVSAC
jgi:hypothetical protein